MTSIYLNQLVNVDAGFKPAVHLPEHFEDEPTNAQLLKSYIPTTQTIELLADIARSLNQSSSKRARLLHGTFGTGKSDLLLVICNYFQRPIDDPIFQSLNDRLKNLNPHLFQTIYEQRKLRKPYLVVLLQADPEKPFSGFILYGLKQALEQANLGELMAPTRYSAAVQKIEDWRKANHPMLGLFTTELQRQAAKELDGLVAELKGTSPDPAFTMFSRVFLAATGSEFNIHEYRQPHATYTQVAKELQERGTHEGILVVCDEFTWFLQRAEQAISSGQGQVEHEMLGVQDLANAAVSSGRAQLHFIVSSLEAFASAGQRSGSAIAADSVERVGGRFESFALGQLNSEELIRGALLPVAGSEGIQRLPQRQRDELLPVAEQLWRGQGHNRDWIKSVILDGAFPLHPLTTYALPLLNRKIAQSSRTMFLFLNDEQGLKGFLARTPLESQYPEWHNLLTLDRLFDYFAESIEAKRPELIDAYAQTSQILQQANVDPSMKAMADRVMKAIVICELSGDINLSATRERLRVALNVPESAAQAIDDALTLLEQLEVIIAPNEANGVYLLPISGKVMPSRLKRLITDKAKEILQESTQLVGLLQNLHAPNPIEAADYNRERGTQRRLNARYLAVGDLPRSVLVQHALDLATGRADGVLFYLVTSNESERQDALVAAREYTRQQPRALVAVPQQPTTVLMALRDYEALRNVRADSSIQPAEQEYLRDTGRIGKPIFDTLQIAIAALMQERSWDFFVNGEPQPQAARGATAAMLASRVMTALYPNTPAHKLSQHIQTDRVSNAVRTAADLLLKGKIQITRAGKTSPDAAVLKQGVSALGLIQSGPPDGAYDTFIINPPTSSANSMLVWRNFEKLGDKYGWPKLIEELRATPFGMYDSLLLLFSACFFALHADEVEILQNRSRLSISVELLTKMIEQPKSYQVRLALLRDTEKRFLQELVRGGLKRPFDSTADRGTPLRLRVATRVNEWLTGRKLPQFAASLSAEDLRGFLPDEAETTIAALPLLLTKNTDADLGGVLLEQLPVALAAPANRDQWDEPTVNELVGRFAAVHRAIEQLPVAIEAAVAGQAATVFGATDLETAWNVLYSWRMRRAVDGKQLSSNTGVLFRSLSSPIGTVRQVLLFDFPSQIVPTIGEYTGWQTLQKLPILVSALQKAFDEIETVWKQNADQQSVWLNGLARAASGRPLTEDQPERIAKLLAQWAAAQRWPACTPALRTSDLAVLAPELDDAQRADLAQVLRRSAHNAEQWQAELLEVLPAQFGVEGWRQPVESGLRRFTAALSTVTAIDARLRQHIIQRIGALFAGAGLRVWRLAHTLPTDNDLSELARTLLQQIDDVADDETLLTSALPRALPEINQPYGQWPSLQQLDRYAEIVRQAVAEIDAYVPLTDAESSWLRGLVTRGLLRPLHGNAREQSRLAEQVDAELRDWLRNLELPVFATRMSADELRAIDATTEAWLLNGAQVVLGTAGSADPSALLLETLPTALDVTTPHMQWSEQDSELLLMRFIRVREFLGELSHILVDQLCSQLAPIFGGNGNTGTPTKLLRTMREWRREYVLTPSTQLSPDARTLADVLQSPEGPDELLLARLPGKLSSVGAIFTRWVSWEHRRTYSTALTEAAAEIARKGQIGDASADAHALWSDVHSRLAHLSADDRRWLIKMLNDELNV